MLFGAAALVATPQMARAQERLTFADASELLLVEGGYRGFYDLARRGPGGSVSADDAAQAAAFLGLERRAADLLADRFSIAPPDPSLSTAPLDEIARRAADTHVVVLSEWHHAPRHRWFLGQVSRRLAALGYRTLAAETFSPVIANAARDRPLTRMQGFYLNDPVFAGAVRGHLQRGGLLRAYDTGSPELSGVERTAYQTDQLQQALGSMPSGHKLLIFAGPGHGAENPSAMAGRIAAATGVNPLTISQRLAHRTTASQGSAALWSANRDEGYDITVYHPLEDAAGERPGWRTTARNRRVRRPRGESGALVVKAYPSEAHAMEIPLDVAVMESSQSVISLACGRSDRISFERG